MSDDLKMGGELVTGMIAALELMINTALKLDPQSLQNLQAFDGKVIHIKLLGLDLDFYLQPSAQGMILLSQYGGTADATLAGRPLKFAEMALGDARKVLFSGDVTISGDVELGQNFKRWMDKLDIDWEEQLSKLTGDIIAHKTGELLRAASAWGLQAIGTLGEDSADYFREESEQLPFAEEIHDFVQQVDTLRNDTARLEARLQALQKNIELQG